MRLGLDADSASGTPKRRLLLIGETQVFAIWWWSGTSRKCISGQTETVRAVCLITLQNSLLNQVAGPTVAEPCMYVNSLIGQPASAAVFASILSHHYELDVATEFNLWMTSYLSTIQIIMPDPVNNLLRVL